MCIGKGNPINLDGYYIEYLWQNVLYKDRLLEILHKYLYLHQKKENKSGKSNSIA